MSCIICLYVSATVISSGSPPLAFKKWGKYKKENITSGTRTKVTWIQRQRIYLISLVAFLQIRD
jgi:hypothetical protein